MENCQLDKSENCCSWSWNCILWLFPAKSGTTKKVRLKEMTSQTVGGLFLTIDLVAYVESNKLLMNCCLVDCVYWKIMLLYAFNVLMSFPLCNFLGYNFQSHSFSYLYVLCCLNQEEYIKELSMSTCFYWDDALLKSSESVPSET